MRHQTVEELKNLPLLKDTSSQKREVGLVVFSIVEFCKILKHQGFISPKVGALFRSVSF